MIGVNPLPVLEVLRLGFGECSGPRDVVKRTVAVIAYLPFARTFGTQFEVVVTTDSIHANFDRYRICFFTSVGGVVNFQYIWWDPYFGDGAWVDVSTFAFT